MTFKSLAFVFIAYLFSTPSIAQTSYWQKDIDAIAGDLTQWRHHIHQYPELGNREFKTADFIAEKLRAWGIEVEMEVAATGVVGILRGKKKGPVIALRADMDALPVTESSSFSWASKETTIYNGNEVGVMHACGHDTHVAILLATAEVLSKHKNELKGTIKFIFQPAEEGAPIGEEGGAKVMVEEGVLKNPDVEAIFGLHISSALEVGKITYRPGGVMASSNLFKITVHGKPSHGAYPWLSVDPILVSAHIITALQSIVSRNLNVTENAAVVTVGSIHGGNRFNIIAPSTEIEGTIRALSVSDQEMIIAHVKRIATQTAEAFGATAEVFIPEGVPVNYNDPALTAKMLPSLEHAVGKDNVLLVPARTGAEDFAFYGQKVPSLFFQLGGMPVGQDVATAPPHHTPAFAVEDAGLIFGVQAFVDLVVNYLEVKD
jgi:amidohydrolase